MLGAEDFALRVASELEDLAESHQKSGSEELAQASLEAAEAVYTYAELLSSTRRENGMRLDELRGVQLDMAMNSRIQQALRPGETIETFIAHAIDLALAQREAAEQATAVNARLVVT